MKTFIKKYGILLCIISFTTNLKAQNKNTFFNHFEVGINVGIWGERPSIGIMFGVRKNVSEWNYGTFQTGLRVNIAIDISPYLDKYYNPNTPKKSKYKGVDLRIQAPQLMIGHQWKYNDLRVGNHLMLGWTSFITNAKIVNKEYNINKKYKNTSSFFYTALYNEVGFYSSKKDFSLMLGHYKPLLNFRDKRVFGAGYFNLNYIN